MCRRQSKSVYVLMLLAAGLLCFWSSQAIAQTAEEPAPPETEVAEPEDLDEGAPNAANPPSYIGELIEATELTQEHVDSMRAGGMGWGEIRIAVRLAEQKVAGSGGTLVFNDALAEVLAARDAGKGYGQIAGENDLKVGQLTGNGKGKAAEAGTVKEKKPGVFARLGRFLGFGKSEQSKQTSKLEDARETGKFEKPQKLERPAKPERPARVERVEKPSKLERPERPEKPERGHR